ncbi:pilus assembly protein [Duganella sp. FT50W]|uniref:Pilus assembly protein n=1 Tax=Duganella lactea TaxID=2692173 RepID=A0A6L8MJ27_9BURK|nr:pilus assembly protein [Duganella lactea]MYM80365.1 pilus assembly protein [Duganella lactea]
MRYVPILLAGALSACTSTTPHWDSRFGVATRMALMQQVIDPAAARNTDPVTGMDGRSARAAYERYQKSGGESQPTQSLATGGLK